MIIIFQHIIISSYHHDLHQKNNIGVNYALHISYIIINYYTLYASLHALTSLCVSLNFINLHFALFCSK